MFKFFRQLLIRTKPLSKSLLSQVSDTDLQYVILDSLEKSIKTAGGNSGKDSNMALKDFANHTTGSQQASTNGATNSILGDTSPLLHDALSHHVSQYHAERQAGRDEAADQHLSQAMKYMALGHKMSGGDEGKFFAASAKPWEKTYADGQAVNFARNIFKANDSGRGGDKFPNHNYLENKPHPSDKKVFEDHKDNSYPWHDVKIGNKHLNLDKDAKPTGKYQPHPLDSHPIMSRVGDMVSDSKDIKNANQRQAPMFYAGVSHTPTEAIDNYHKKSLDWADKNMDFLGDVHDKHSDENYGAEPSERLHDVTKHRHNAERNVSQVLGQEPESYDEPALDIGLDSKQEQKPDTKAAGEEKSAQEMIDAIAHVPEGLRPTMERSLGRAYSETEAYKNWASKNKS